MGTKRDDFLKNTLEVMAKRVGFLCSRPDCGVPTVGPNTVSDAYTSIGVGAHITAAAKGGPRYDSSLSVAERRAIGNGIWLCASCSVLIDRDPAAFPVVMLQGWKTLSEEKARNLLYRTPLTKPALPAIYGDLIYNGSMRGYFGKSVRAFRV
jgi:hypothetical protein